jgi:hypothetical protein
MYTRVKKIDCRANMKAKIIMPQKTFGSIPCPIDLISSTMVLGQPFMAHGMGETVSHTLITMAYKIYRCGRLPIK